MSLIRLSLTALTFCLATLPAFAAESGAEAKPRPTWESLFDGKSLDNWKESGGGKWTVENGEIVGSNGDGRYGWLCTKKDYADFVLELECKHEAPGNSGIQFRSHLIDDNMHGYQAEFDPRPDHGTGGVYEEKGRLWLKKPDEKGLAAMKPMEWNRYRIEAINDHIQLQVNGVTTVEFYDNGARSGLIALQVHSGDKPVKVRWRNIRIRDLGDGGGWEKLFNGESLAGWHTHGEENVWHVRDGMIVGELIRQSPYAYLVTDRKYGDFELKLNMIFDSNDGNSGVFFRCDFPEERNKDKATGVIPPYEKRVHIAGPQAEFAPPGNNTAGIYDAAKMGWVNQDDMTDQKQKMHRFHEWNEMRIRMIGSHITTWLNGYLVSDISAHEFPREGIIALQLHAGGPMKVRFKDILIREPKPLNTEK